MSCLHVLRPEPIALEHRLIAQDAVPAAATQDFTQVPPGTWLLRHIPWTEAEHVISALNAGPKTARQLAISPGDACLVLNRRTWLQGFLITDVRLVYPASRHRFTGRFSPRALT